MIVVQGERVALREWRGDDVDAMHRWLGNPDVTRFLSWASDSVGESAEHLQECIAAQQEAPRTRYFLALALVDTGEVIGDAGFEWTSSPDGSREGELGYFLVPETWGHGYATEAALLVLELAFDRLGASVMRASCNAKNRASERVMQRCGMRREPEREEPGRRMYRITRDEWLLR